MPGLRRFVSGRFAQMDAHAHRSAEEGRLPGITVLHRKRLDMPSGVSGSKTRPPPALARTDQKQDTAASGAQRSLTRANFDGMGQLDYLTRGKSRPRDKKKVKVTGSIAGKPLRAIFKSAKNAAG